jgi:hypothetical protein
MIPEVSIVGSISSATPPFHDPVLAPERGRDDRRVVVDHADIGALVGPFFAHGVGVQFAPDHDLVAAGRRPFDQGADIAVRDRAFDEDGADVRSTSMSTSSAMRRRPASLSVEMP